MKRIKRLSKKAIKYAELSGYDIQLFEEDFNKGAFILYKLENKSEMDYHGVDYNYPYVIYSTGRGTCQQDYNYVY